MIKAAIEKVEDLIKKSSVVTIDGIKYSTESLNQIDPPIARRLPVSSLSGFCDFVNQNIDKCVSVETHFIHVVKEDTVLLYSNLHLPERKREILISAEPLSKSKFEFGEFYDQEEFIIKLRTLFDNRETTDSEYLLSYTSRIVTESTVEGEDDGVAQKVTIRKGTSGVLHDKTTLKPIVKLAPYRTFIEVEQPESEFLFRVQDGGRCALFEADGGAWRIKAVQNIVAYLKERVDIQVIA